MDIPSFLPYYAEKIGKPLSEFTIDDWKGAAFLASRCLDKAIPKAKPRGRPKKKRFMRLADLLMPSNSTQQGRPRGRPQQRYGKDRNYSIEAIAEVLSEITAPEARRQSPSDAPWNQTEALRVLLRVIGHPAHYEKAVMRAVRRYKSGQKSVNKSG